MKKIFYILIAIISAVVSFSKFYVTQSASAFTPVDPTPIQKGIAFDNYIDISISKEILDITFLNDGNVKVKDTYILKNNLDIPVNFNAAFISANFLDIESQKVILERNGGLLNFAEKQFINDSDKRKQWGEGLFYQLSFDKKLSGEGFKLYTVNKTKSVNTVTINKSATLFSYNVEKFIETDDTFEYTSKKEITFVTDSLDIDFGIAAYTVLEIEDINEYIYNLPFLSEVEEKVKDLYFRRYMYDVNINEINDISLLNTRYYPSTAIISNIDNAPKEEIVISASYISDGGGFIGSSNFLYNFASKIYWSETNDVTINLMLNKKYPRIDKSILRNSNFSFQKTESKVYVYNTKNLQSAELDILVQESLFSEIIFNTIIILIFTSPIWVAALALIFIFKKVRKKRKIKLMDKKAVNNRSFL